MECLREPRSHLHPLHEAAALALAEPHRHHHPVGSLEERQVIVVDGSDEHVHSSIPDEHFAAVLALVSP